MRTWVFCTLQASGLWTLVEGRLYAASRMTQAPPEKLCSFYRMGSSTGRLHTDAPAKSTPFQVFVLDEPGDYERIDEGLELARVALCAIPLLCRDDSVIQCHWTETSGDIPEDVMSGAISKFSRFTVVHT